jgi:radical SAM superfamily enzyme YgiQ (UPF0313 family)
MGKKRILLIRVPEIEINNESKDLRTQVIAGLSLPLGIAHLVAIIKKQNIYDVMVLDLFADYFKEVYTAIQTRSYDRMLSLLSQAIGNGIKDFKPDAVGFSALFLFQHYLTKALIEDVKKNFPTLDIFLGGYSTLIPELVLYDIPQLDIAFIGESEKAFQDVLLARINKHPIDTIGGIGYRNNGVVVVNKNQNIQKDLSKIPCPDFDLIPLSTYKSIVGQIEMPFLTSRGCPFSCGFCSSFLYSNRLFRHKPIEQIKIELNALHKKCDFDVLMIRDENFNANKQHAKSTLQAFTELDLGFSWTDTNAFHVNSLDEEFLDLCKKSNCERAIFAIESGSPRVLKEIMNKNVNLDHARAMAKYCNSIDLTLECYFVIGSPGETMDEIKQTIDLAVKLDLDHCTFSIATPFPGTEYYKYAVQHKLIDESINTIGKMQYMSICMSYENFSAEEMKDVQYDANILVNFLASKCLRGDRGSLEKSLARFKRTSEQYPFHAVAVIVVGYLYFMLGDKQSGIEYFKKATQLFSNENISRSYSKFIEYDTPATNAYRDFITSMSVPQAPCS